MKEETDRPLDTTIPQTAPERQQVIVMYPKPIVRTKLFVDRLSKLTVNSPIGFDIPGRSARLLWHAVADRPKRGVTKTAVVALAQNCRKSYRLRHQSVAIGCIVGTASMALAIAAEPKHRIILRQGIS